MKEYSTDTICIKKIQRQSLLDLFFIRILILDALIFVAEAERVTHISRSQHVWEIKKPKISAGNGGEDRL